MNKYLPIGSIIEVKNAKFIIAGYLGKKTEDNKVYDYLCTIFPFGAISNEYLFFNNEDIDKVVFIGYQDGLTTYYGEKMGTLRKMYDDNCSEEEIKEYLESVVLKKNEE